VTDRILYRGIQLDLAIYSRSELQGSDHKPGFHSTSLLSFRPLEFSSPVFALFCAQVLIIDAIKRATLSRLLLENIISTGPGEKLDEKLAALVLPVERIERSLLHLSIPYNVHMFVILVPPPSSDETAWWDGPGQSLLQVLSRLTDGVTDCPDGVLPLYKYQNTVNHKTNPFDSPFNSSISSSPSSSDEELYTDALSLQTPMAPVQATRKPPPPPPSPRPVKNENL
jgi:hypothetical protein